MFGSASVPRVRTRFERVAFRRARFSANHAFEAQFFDAAETADGRGAAAERIELQVLEGARVRLLGLAGARPALDLAGERVLREGARRSELACGGEGARGFARAPELIEQGAAEREGGEWCAGVAGVLA